MSARDRWWLDAAHDEPDNTEPGSVLLVPLVLAIIIVVFLIAVMWPSK